MTEREELLIRLQELIRRISTWSEWPDEADIGSVLTDIEEYLAQERME